MQAVEPGRAGREEPRQRAGRSANATSSVSSASRRSSASSASALSMRRPWLQRGRRDGDDLADLRRDEPQPAAVEGEAEGRRHLRVAIPAQLDDRRLRARRRRARRQGRRAVALAWKTTSASPGASRGCRSGSPAPRRGRGATGRCRRPSPRRPAGAPPARRRGSRGRPPRPPRCGRPAPAPESHRRVERRLHVGGEHRAAGGTPSGTTRNAAAGATKRS